MLKAFSEVHTIAEDKGKKRQGVNYQVKDRRKESLNKEGKKNRERTL
jgi:hypothetical protein